MPTGGAPGLQNIRPGNAGANSAMASFGQTMSGSQPATALDLSWVSMKRLVDEAKTNPPATSLLCPEPHNLNIRIQDKRYGLNDQHNKAKRNANSKTRRILPSKD